MDIQIQPTPNPNALKFILDKPVKIEGNSSYRSPMDCGDNNLALTLFTVRGVDQLHFYDNVITITKFGYEEWDSMEPTIMEYIGSEYPKHDPNYFDPDPEAERRANLTPELKEIEAILDKTIRPGLQGDGGDIQTISFEDNILLVQYKVSLQYIFNNSHQILIKTNFQIYWIIKKRSSNSIMFINRNQIIFAI